MPRCSVSSSLLVSLPKNLGSLLGSMRDRHVIPRGRALPAVAVAQWQYRDCRLSHWPPAQTAAGPSAMVASHFTMNFIEVDADSELASLAVSGAWAEWGACVSTGSRSSESSS